MELIELFDIKIEKDDVTFVAILQDIAGNIDKISKFVEQLNSKKVNKGSKRP